MAKLILVGLLAILAAAAPVAASDEPASVEVGDETTVFVGDQPVAEVDSSPLQCALGIACPSFVGFGAEAGYGVGVTNDHGNHYVNVPYLWWEGGDNVGWYHGWVCVSTQNTC